MTRPIRTSAAAFFIAALFAATQTRAAELPAPVANALATYGIAESKLSLVVRAMDDGAPVLRHNAEVARNPASVIKLLTTLAALELLGPNYRWQTVYLADGALTGGVLNGDLVLRGGGDPFITVEDFLGHLLALRQAGLARIKGNLIIDNAKFATARHDRDAFDQKPTRSYNVGPDAALINLSATRFVIEPRDGRIDARLEPPLAFVSASGNIKARGGKCISPDHGWGYRITRDEKTSAPKNNSPSSSKPFALSKVRVDFTGVYREQCGRHEIARSILPNTEYACRLFIALWREMGGEVGGCGRGKTPQHARELLTREGATLADIITGINKFSNNVMSRQLLLTLGAEKIRADESGGDFGGGDTVNSDSENIYAESGGVINSDSKNINTESGGETVNSDSKNTGAESGGDSAKFNFAQLHLPPATNMHGITAIHDWLTAAAVDMPKLAIDNGAGLSRHTRATAAGLSRLLVHAWRSRYRPEFLSSLPLAATDGTMRKRLTDGKIKSRARIKTGLINDIRSMAGYIYAADGKYYAVAMMIDSRRVNFTSGNAVQDAVLEWVFGG